MGKAVQDRSDELHGEIPERRYVVTVLSLWASGLPHEFGDAMLALKPIHFAQLRVE